MQLIAGLVLYQSSKKNDPLAKVIITINILLFLKVRDLRFYAGKSHNLIGQGIFHGDQKSRDLHEKNPETYIKL